MSEASIGSTSPDDALALANAIALRSGQSEIIAEQILAGLTGAPYRPKSPEELRQANIGRTILYLAKVESPETPISWKELADVTNGNGSCENTAEELSKSLGLVGVETDAEVIGKTIAGAGMTDDKITKDFAKMLAMARKVAAEHGVEVADVYSTDELYYETSKRAFSPDESAGELSKVIDSLSVEMLNEVMVRQLENEVEPGELAEMITEMQLDPEVQASLAEYAELMKEALRQAQTYHFTKTYGLETLKSLSTAHRLALMPRRPLVPGVFDTLS